MAGVGGKWRQLYLNNNERRKEREERKEGRKEGREGGRKEGRENKHKSLYCGFHWKVQKVSEPQTGWCR